MQVLIDTSPLKNANAVRGVGRYTRELLQALRALGTTNQFFDSETVGDHAVDLIHYPYFDFFFATLPFQKKAPTIVTIHDVIPLIFPRHYPKGIRGTVRFYRQKLALRSVAQVITDSDISKRDIVQHLRLSPEKVSVVHLAASPAIQKPPQAVIETIRKKYELPKTYALYVGDINYNKNLTFLIGAMRQVPKLTLALVGKSMNNVAIPEGRELQKAILSSEMEKRVKKITTVESTEELSALYAGAALYIQPSLYEGFGLPILEAMQCRTPVVCSRGGSLPEIAGDAAIYFHPLEVDECVMAILKVLKMSERQRQTQIEHGVWQAERFNWRKTAEETLAVYEKVLQTS